MARHFDRTLFEFIIERCGTQMPHGEWARICEMSMVHRLSDGSGYAFDAAVRETFALLLPAADRERTRELLIEYYSRDLDRIGKIAQSNRDGAETMAKNACEVFYQKSQRDPRAALMWWDKACKTILDAGFARMVESIDRACIPLAASAFGPESS